jgi:hypothetical protein
MNGAKFSFQHTSEKQSEFVRASKARIKGASCVVKEKVGPWPRLCKSPKPKLAKMIGRWQRGFRFFLFEESLWDEMAAWTEEKRTEAQEKSQPILFQEVVGHHNSLILLLWFIDC